VISLFIANPHTTGAAKMANLPEMVVVHCSATPAKMDVGAKEIDRWHRQRGWLGIGYHYVIRRDGTVEEGRPEDRPGAHAYGYNKVSIGICLVGGLSTRKRPYNNFTKEQFAALRKLIDSIFLRYRIRRVVGHRDLDPHKDCPSFDVKSWAEHVGLL